jgi:hypothetical protein
MNLLLKEGPDPGNPQSKWVDPVQLSKMKDPVDAAVYLAEKLKDALESMQEPDRGLED